MRRHFFYLILPFIITAFTACDDSFSDSITAYSVDITLVLPEDVDEVLLSDATVMFTNLSSGNVSQFRYPLATDVTLLPGIYDVEFHALYPLAGGGESPVRGVTRSVQIASNHTLITLKAFRNIEADDLIISEIFFTGTLQSSGNQYYGDDYVKLYNNTNHVVYADGITLFESKFITTQKLKYEPDIMDEAVTVHALYTIPGSGKDHPVQPGEYILLADVGIDHRTVNPNSFSLLHADWEWYDVSTSPSNMDIDSPEVPNLDKWYCYTLSFWMLHNRGLKAYGIARIPIFKEEFLRDYWYTYNYDIITNVGTFPVSQSAYRLPNEWVVDVVNCSVAAAWQWNVTSPQLDMGWAHCGTIDYDKTRYFHAVRRKLLYVTEEGRAVFQDTNNSTADFNSNVTPSEIEIQHTITGLGEDNSTEITYDGITPIL